MIRKEYPYLQEQYVYNLNEEQAKRKFLQKIDKILNQRQYIQITLLDWNENPIKEIQGEITGGSISKDGASSVRRTANLSCSVDGGIYDISDLSLDLSIKTKIFVEIGIKNETNQYTDWPILWFPEGVFIITDLSINSATSSAVNISLTLKDKMCLLNGDVGGLLPASVQFDIMDTQLPSGEIAQQKVLIYQIILELVNHYGGIDLNNIIIQDVPLMIKQVVKWNGSNPIWQTQTDDIETGSTQYMYDLEKRSDLAVKFEAGQDIGYIYKDFIINDDLVGDAGTPITTILDTLKDKLGNYEYFFDVFGIFIFREIKNYLNITQAQIVEEESQNPGRRINFGGGNFLLDEGSEKQYLIETTNEKTTYAFSDDSNLTSITVTPQFKNIKNDYIVQGIRQGTSDDTQHMVRYHLAIDTKPEIIGYNEQDGREYYGVYDNVVYYTDTQEAETQRVNKLGIVLEVDQLPEIGNLNTLYYNEETVFCWDGKIYKEVFLITEDEQGQEIQNKVTPDTYYAYDWRTFLYLYGLEALVNGLDTNYYFSELEAFWPLEYDLNPKHQKFFGEKEDKVVSSEGNFFLDFIDDNSSSLGQYSVNAIGRRQQITVKDEINCLFTPEIPNVVFLNKDNPKDNWTENTAGVLTTQELNNLYRSYFPTGESPENLIEEAKLLAIQRKECQLNTQPWTQVSQEIFQNLSIGGYCYGAYEQIRYELFCHTRYQNSLSITGLPVYYLEPNSRVELASSSVNIYGDFMVQNISIALGPGANMSCVLNEIAERL